MRGTSLPPGGPRRSAGQEEVRSRLQQKPRVGRENVNSAAFNLCPTTPFPISKIWKSCSSSLEDTSSCPKAQNERFGDQTPIGDPNTPSSLPPPHSTITLLFKSLSSCPGLCSISAGAASEERRWQFYVWVPPHFAASRR